MSMFVTLSCMAAMFAFFSAPCLSDSHTGNGEPPTILILGAGLSGVTVAKTLEEAGHQNFLLIEGSSRLGGRIKSTKLAGHTVELGAMWMYGAGTNPIYKLLKDNNIEVIEDIPFFMTMRDNAGNNITDQAIEAQLRLEEAIDAFDIDAKEAFDNNLTDFTVASRLRYYNWLPETIIDDAIEGYLCDWEFAVSPAYLSGKHVHWWAPFEAFDSYDYPMVNDRRGFELLVNHLGSNVTKEKLRLNEIITQIKQDKDGVDVLTASGSSYHGDLAVVTFGIGVLQRKELIFSPELPDCKRLAIDGFGMAYMTQIYLKFPSVFWDDTPYILYASDQRGKNSIWVNLDFILPGSKILQLSVMGEESRRIERLDDQAVVDDILRHLRLMYPNHVVPSPDNYTISRWTYDPMTYGAYSYWPPSFTMDNMTNMMAPFGRVYFAGEHLDPVQYRYMHAAYASGMKTASDVLKCIRDMESCALTTTEFRCIQPESMEEDNCVSSAGFHFSIVSLLRWTILTVSLTALFTDHHWL